MVESNVGKNPEGTASFTVCTLIWFDEIIDPPRVVNYMFKGRDEGSSGQVQVLIAISES